ncbi:MAG: kynureninase, partial [Hyphomicrobiales bacterium]|nr:kynureninase [Hyphomicrobiales bacterium]
MSITREDCLALDASDPLRACRARFQLEEGVIYLDGNSLGALPHGVAEHVAQVVEHEWGKGLSRSWIEAGWYVSPARVGAKLAPLLGAKHDEVTVTESISINLFKLLVAAARLRPARSEILAERGNFPSDNHIVESVARLLGKKTRFVPAGEIVQAVGADTGVVTL